MVKILKTDKNIISFTNNQNVTDSCSRFISSCFCWID